MQVIDEMPQDEYKRRQEAATRVRDAPTRVFDPVARTQHHAEDEMSKETALLVLETFYKM